MKIRYKISGERTKESSIEEIIEDNAFDVETGILESLSNEVEEIRRVLSKLLEFLYKDNKLGYYDIYDILNLNDEFVDYCDIIEDKDNDDK